MMREVEAEFEREDVSTSSESGLMQSGGADSTKVVREVQVRNKTGLHARPAMQFVDLANKYISRITVCKDQQRVNAKSIMELLLLAAGEGTKLTIQAEGPDARKAAEALARLIEDEFEDA